MASMSFPLGANNYQAPIYPWSPKPVAPAAPSASAVPAAMSPLSALIASLSGAAGNLNQNQGARQEAIGAAQGTRDAYDKEAAFADAQGLMAAQLQQAMQESMGTLNRAAGGAGASQSSMMALLAQQAAQDAAQGAATLGAEQAVAYGQINNQSSNVLESLTRTDPTELNALISAVGMQSEIRSRNQADRLARDQMDAREEEARQARRTGGSNNAPRAQIGAGAARQQPVVMGGVATGGGGGGSAPSTSSFFNRPGGVLAGAGGGMTSYGPVAGADQALLSTMQNGTLPSQQWNGTPVPADLFTSGLKF